MASRIALALLAFVIFAGRPGAAAAADRFALVIGNSEYQSVAPLPNPVRDAKAVGEFLTRAGFEVISALNLGQADMRLVLRDFVSKFAGKGEDSVALVYFAGHGLQIDGRNYLVPVDARIDREADVALQSVRLDDVMNALEDIPGETRIVILDACRNNPFSQIGKDTGRGLAIVNAPAGSLVAYSTSPGAVAEDGAGANSPFAQALIAAASRPGAPIENVLKDARLSVHDKTAGRQTPWEVSALTVPFAFFPGADGGREAEAGKPADAWRRELQGEAAERAFERVMREDRVAVYQVFLELFPQFSLAPRVRGIVSRRLEMQAWFDAVTLNSAAGFKAFLARYPNSDLAATAERLMQRAEGASAFASASPGTLGVAADAAPAAGVRTVIREVRVPSPPEIRTVIKEVPKTIIKEVRVPSPPEIRTVVRTVRVPEIRTVTKVVRVPTPCRCSVPGGPPRGPPRHQPLQRLR